ncbi:hypothetical protein PWT90_04187 [Aphanocladium album]|nr:hypothetical protein PWT90_04187 [Aphanocladium album]
MQELIGIDYFEAVRNVLAFSDPWQDYREHFTDDSIPATLFGLVMVYQRRSADGINNDKPQPRRITYAAETYSASVRGNATATTAPGRSLTTEASFTTTITTISADAVAENREAEDQGIVNFALIMFMNALLLQRTQASFGVAGGIVVDGMFRLEGASSEQTVQQYANKQRYYPGKATDSAPVTEDEGTSSHSATDTEAKATHNSGNKRKLTAEATLARQGKLSANKSRSRASKTGCHSAQGRSVADPAVAPSESKSKEQLTIGTLSAPKIAESPVLKQTGSGDAGPAADDETSEEANHTALQKLFNITIIAEVKRMTRCNYYKAWRQSILRQESAQMVAWTAEVPMLPNQKPGKDGRYQRLLLSQDQREIFLNVATYTDNYIHYIMNCSQQPAYNAKLLEGEDFLDMRPYGPFRVDKLDQMESLAALMLVLSHRYVI